MSEGSALKPEQAQQAVERISTFQDLYGRMVEARYRGDADAVVHHQHEMALTAGMVQRDLDRVHLGQFTLREAPALGGRMWNANVTAMVLSGVADEYNVNPNEVSVGFQRAIGEYRALAADDEDTLEVWVNRALPVVMWPISVVGALVSFFWQNVAKFAALTVVIGALYAGIHWLG